MKNKKSLLLVHVLVLLSFLLAACSGVAMPTATQIPKPTVAGSGRFPVGTFKPDHPLDTVSIQFNAQGTFLSDFGSGSQWGHYVVSGDQIVLNTDDGFCDNHPGTYHWEIHENTLLLKPINETCTASSRSDDLAGRSWILQP